MSGNLILLGLRLGGGETALALDNVLAIAGLVVGTLCCGAVMRRVPWRSAVGVTLAAELTVLIAAGGLVCPKPPRPCSPADHHEMG